MEVQLRAPVVGNVTARPRVYLAGPDVFLADPLAFAQLKKDACAKAGLEGVFPLDAGLKFEDGLSPKAKADAIAFANENLMRSCHALVANCTPFRGTSMDAGTAYEVGYMRALGRPVFGYSNVAEDYATRAGTYRASGHSVPFDGDTPDTEIESFDLAENLMIACAIHASGGVIVTANVLPEHRLTDLSAFIACLEQVKAALANAGR